MAHTAPKANSLPLNNATLDRLPDGVLRPTYDRAALTPGIVHIGVGNFHRAHQAWYLHRLMQQGDACDWAIIGAGVRAYDATMRDKLLAQDCLTTLIELDPSGMSAEVIGSMIDYLPIEPTNGALIAKMADPAIRIVGLTVTEGGYYTDPATGDFDAMHPDMVHDAAHPHTPRTAFGAIVEALRQRRDAGTGPFSALSCDNLLGNGKVLRQTVLSLARLSDPDLAEWIDAECSFPNSMVDCIAPATGPEERALGEHFGISDAAPVTHENFRQWVIEDDFCAGRPDWDKVGATFSSEVKDYETMKLRILNAGHQVLANVGEILSIDTIAKCMQNADIAAFFNKVLTVEIAPHVQPVPNMTALQYVAQVELRFRNPSIKDTTRRVAFDGSSRHPGFLLPLVDKALKTDAPLEGLALVEALWAHMCTGQREDGSTIEPNDPHWDNLNRVALAAQDQPEAWLEQASIYGDLGHAPRFRDAFVSSFNAVKTLGAAQAIRDYVGG
jgi:mannitol 2-dehydrogenase